MNKIIYSVLALILLTYMSGCVGQEEEKINQNKLEWGVNMFIHDVWSTKVFSTHTGLVTPPGVTPEDYVTKYMQN